MDIYIQFDSVKLHRTLHTIFQDFAVRPHQLSGCLVDKRFVERGLVRLDPSIFDTILESGEDDASDTKVEDEGPPSYAARSPKRPRHPPADTKTHFALRSRRCAARELKLAADRHLLARKQQLLAVNQTLLERNQELMELQKGYEERKKLAAVEESERVRNGVVRKDADDDENASKMFQGSKAIKYVRSEFEWV
ncbi:hypothetical protein HBH92_221180 [Parastagonospora nodorum]|nr:hypothetical protein HBH51_231540 [Parastagonospora nodorum]KAH4045071.1 hypothetical protein HBH49_204410 [Parastagonospora nodorum]KAH4062848.1 hypothetical protein HBH50_203090 [Parastagonospora nodorum]KAH4081607.1 hypothetical protein HBH48_198730 [Parastagonospora nodorum]KAH4401581.1 hypothetical protein HBH92_221180 [Parastagonospora nodorum]